MADNYNCWVCRNCMRWMHRASGDDVVPRCRCGSYMTAGVINEASGVPYGVNAQSFSYNYIFIAIGITLLLLGGSLLIKGALSDESNSTFMVRLGIVLLSISVTTFILVARLSQKAYHTHIIIAKFAACCIIVGMAVSGLLYIIPHVVSFVLDPDATISASIFGDNKKYKITYLQSGIYQNSPYNDKYTYIMAKITNISKDILYIGSATADYIDINGNVVQSDDNIFAYPRVIKPGESAYYFTNNKYDGVSSDVNIKLKENVQIATVNYIRLDISNLRTTITANGLNVKGKVTNETDKDQSLVYIAVLLLDDNGKPLSVITAYENNMPVGVTRSFDINDCTLGNVYDKSEVVSCQAWAFPIEYQSFS